VLCDKHPYLKQSTPPMFTIVRYDALDRVMALAVFTPVPCRMYGKCDRLLQRSNIEEPDLVDHDAGLRVGLVALGQRGPTHDYDLPSMQQRMIDGLSVELQNRFGLPVWRDVHAYGTVWATRYSEIGLFVLDRGRWVVETYEFHPRRMPTLALRGR
jgi:hypothetical protein